jgi:hypothetical protein
LAVNDEKDWSCIAGALREISPESWQKRRERNVRLYDHFMAPEAVANYVLKAAQEFVSESKEQGI